MNDHIGQYLTEICHVLLMYVFCTGIIVYAAVQFVTWRGGNSVMSIPETWVFNQGNELWCYFAEFNQLTHIKNATMPRGDWKKYQIKQLSRKPIKTYEMALEKESEPRFTSGIDTDSCSEDTVKSERRHTQNEDYAAAGQLIISTV
jgi:hypothetical protein